MIAVGHCTPETLIYYWESAKPLLARLLKQPGCKGYDLEDLRIQLLQGLMQLWYVKEGIKLKAVALTEIRRYPQDRALLIWGLAGEEREKWENILEDMLSSFAIYAKASYLEAYTRKGVTKLLTERGWDEIQSVCRKQVTV